MKIIVSRGINTYFTKIKVFKNSQEITILPSKKDTCELEAKDGDQFIVKLKFLDTSTLTIAAFTYGKGKDVYYVRPSITYQRWEVATYVLAYFSMLFLTINFGVESEAFGWFCTAMVILTAVCLIDFKANMLIPSIRKKWFRTETL